jgi:hypothetical protein
MEAVRKGRVVLAGLGLAQMMSSNCKTRRHGFFAKPKSLRHWPTIAATLDLSVVDWAELARDMRG